MTTRLETRRPIEIRGIDEATPKDLIVGNCPDERSFLEITSTIDPKVKHLLNTTPKRTIFRSVPDRSLYYTKFDSEGKQICRRRAASQVILRERERVVITTPDEIDIFVGSNIPPDITPDEQKEYAKLPTMSTHRHSRKENVVGFILDFTQDVGRLLKLSRPTIIPEKAKRKFRQYIPGRRARMALKKETRRLKRSEKRISESIKVLRPAVRKLRKLVRR